METKSNRKRTWLLLAASVAVVFAVGYAIGQSGGNGNNQMTAEAHDHSENAGSGEDDIQFWTCSMHPQIQQEGPGQCPICGMELIPVYEDAGDSGELGAKEIKLSAYARKLAEIQTSEVKRTPVEARIRMPGKITYDERKTGYITAWAPGRIDKLYVDFTGTVVNKGDPMAYIYSPELYSAQQELVEAGFAYRKMRSSGLESLRRTARETVDAARKKLELLGLTPEQVNNIERTKQADEHITVTAPSSGVVVHKNANEGIYVKTGEKLYTISDLSTVWGMMDAYESDIPWLSEGQEVVLTTDTYPGEGFSGKVEYIDPFLRENTRTAKVRVTVPNKDGRLKPGMLVHGVAKPGTNELKKVAENMGTEEEMPLVVPASAPLITGKRAVVYVADPEREGVYQGREIVLGPRAGDYYLVKSGLSEGEMVVTNGAFKIDSALQIQAKPSMMSPEGGAAMSGHAGHGTMAKSPPESDMEGELLAKADTKEGKDQMPADAPPEFRKQLEAVYKAYLSVQKSLSGDDLERAKKASGQVLDAVGKVDMGLVKGDAHMKWMKQEEAIKKNAEELKDSDDLEEARVWFEGLSNAVLSVAETFGSPSDMELYKVHCPMAFDNKGADWLQSQKDVMNPYYGSKMYRCGEVVATMPKAGPSDKGSDSKEGHVPVKAYDTPPEFKKEMGALLDRYFELQTALAIDDLDEAIGAAELFRAQVDKVDASRLEGEARKSWEGHAVQMKEQARKLERAQGLSATRAPFRDLSKAVISAAFKFGAPEDKTVYLVHCPMAFSDHGADWLQKTDSVMNPYYGEKMQKCGEVVGTVGESAGSGTKGSEHKGSEHK